MQSIDTLSSKLDTIIKLLSQNNKASVKKSKPQKKQAASPVALALESVNATPIEAPTNDTAPIEAPEKIETPIADAPTTDVVPEVVQEVVNE